MLVSIQKILGWMQVLRIQKTSVVWLIDTNSINFYNSKKFQYFSNIYGSNIYDMDIYDSDIYGKNIHDGNIYDIEILNMNINEPFYMTHI